MNCDKVGCKNQAMCHPVLLLRVHPSHQPARATLDLNLCAECIQETTLDDLITDEGWDMLLTKFKRAGLQKPRRELTILEFDPL